MNRYVTASALALSWALLLANTAQPVSAQSAPSPAPIPTPVALPTVPASIKLDPLARYGVDLLLDMAHRQIDARANSATGIVSYFKRFDLDVQTGTNRYRNVRLHQGTIINPRGASLSPGQRVEVGGRSQPDGTLEADTITIDQ